MIKKLFNKTLKKYSNFESKRKRKRQQNNELKQQLNTQSNIETRHQDSSNDVIDCLELNKIKSELNLICTNESNDLIDYISTESSESNSSESNSSELNYSDNKMPCENQLIDHHQINKMDKLANDKIIDNFTNGVNISGISRRRILANIDYDTDTKFMCSTLLKEEDKNNSKFKFNSADDYVTTKDDNLKLLENNNQKSIKLSNNKLIEFNCKKDNQSVENKFQSKKSLINNRKSSHKTSTLLISKTNKQINRLDQDQESIYDTRKPPFSDLSSIEEETKLDYLNNLKNNNSKFNSIDRRNNQYLNEFKSAKFDRSNDLLNNNSKLFNNYFDNNQSFVSDYDDSEMWYCKTKLYEDHIDEIIYKWENLSMDNEIWCKLICFERNKRIAKAYIRLPYLIVNNGKTGFDGYTIGLEGFENDYRDNETKYIIKNLEKGVRIKIDENGNLIFKKMCQLTVYVKDWLQQLTADGSGSLSDDIIGLHGKLPYNQPIKVFDIERFANNLRLELEKPTPNRRLLARQCILPIVFGKNTYNLLNAPCWILICNIEGLRMIESITKIPTPDYGLPTVDDNTLKEEEEESSGSCSNNLSSDSMNSNSEEDNQFYSRFKRNRNSHIYSSI